MKDTKKMIIQCFNGKFVLIPFLDVKSGSDMMYGTSAYLFFTNKSLEYLTFQLVGNSIAANWIVDKFKQSATELLGEPVIEGHKISWSNSESEIVIEKYPGSPHAHFHWITKI